MIEHVQVEQSTKRVFALVSVGDLAMALLSLP